MAMLQNFSSFHQSIKITPLKIHIFTCNCVKPKRHYHCSSKAGNLLGLLSNSIEVESGKQGRSYVVLSIGHPSSKNYTRYTEQIKEPRQYFTGRLGNVEYVVCRDDGGKIHAFHNVCRHRASPLASASGKNSCFVCPYHGWTYGLDGALQKATRITGIKNFRPVCSIAGQLLGWWLSCTVWSLDGHESCTASRTIFDYFLDSSHKDDESFIAQNLQDSETVQIEDMKLCEAVQRGLESPAFCSGRYVPQVEKAVHHFHSLLYESPSN